MNGSRLQSEDLQENYNANNVKLNDLYNAINDFEKELKKIDEISNSAWSVASRFIMGDKNKGKKLTDEKFLTLSSDELSSTDLKYKKSLIMQQLEMLSQQVSGLEPALRVLEKEFKALKKKEKATFLDKFEIELQKEYLSSPDKFFSGVLFKAPLSQQKSDEIYANARKVIVASSVFKFETNRYKTLEAWHLVAEARKRALNNYRESSLQHNVAKTEKMAALHAEFTKGASVVFGNMVDKLPTGWQALKTLYEFDSERAEDYFVRLQVNAENPEKSFAKVGNKIIDVNFLVSELRAVNLNIVKSALERVPGFNKLSDSVKNQLIELQSDVNQLSFDLSYVRNDNDALGLFSQLNTYNKMLAAAIKNAIANNRTEEDIASESDRIKASINREAKEIRKKMFLNQITDSIQIPIGAGLGLAWLVGGGVPVAIASAALAALMKAELETSSSRMEVSSIQNSYEIVNSEDPLDASFLINADKKWQAMHVKGVDGSKIPNIHINSINKDVDNVVNGVQELARETYHTNITKTIEKTKSTAVTLYLGLFGGPLILLMVILVIAAPVLWPIPAVIGGLATLGFGYVLARKMMKPANPAPSLIGPVVDVFYDRTAKFGRAVTNVLAQPFYMVSNMFSNNRVDNKSFSSDRLIDSLRKLSPDLGIDLARQLSKHFNHRLAQAQHDLKQAIATNSKEDILSVTKKIGALESDWEMVLSSSNNEKTLIANINDYLDKSYVQAKAEFLSKDRSKSKTILFDNVTKEPLEQKLKVSFGKDYVGNQEEIQELIAIKEKFVKISKEKYN